MEPYGETELRIVVEPELSTALDTRDKAVDSKSMERGSAYCTMAEGELTRIWDCWRLKGMPKLIYMPTCPFSSCLCPSSLLVLFRPWRPFGNFLSTLSCLPALRAGGSQMTTHPPAPASAFVWQPLCSPSARRLCSGITMALPVSIGVIAGGSLCFRLQLLSQGLHLGPLTQRLHWLHRAPSFLQLRLGLSSTICHLGIHSSGSASSLWLCQALPWAPPPPAPLPSVGRWSHQPFLHDGFSLRWLHCESPLRLWPGSHLAPPAPSPSCFLPGSSLRHLQPGLCLSSSSRVSVLLSRLLLSSHSSLPLFFLWRKDAPSGRGANCYISGPVLLCFLSACALHLQHRQSASQERFRLPRPRIVSLSKYQCSQHRGSEEDIAAFILQSSSGFIVSKTALNP
ncbi:Leucine-rich repeat-containing G-protein coupled receptor 5 [Labeo rohita]|uniref:Leucine-rich repeat-containing G-protein coupled receptor 5 n=1 Tax=Labeo rohita TaxID=84645 RepID=A0ABQ8LGP7_LABRO|nr:Leucine-rich repeat-containing G-protein coupled receptor 5 [Labeo rohita]